VGAEQFGLQTPGQSGARVTVNAASTFCRMERSQVYGLCAQRTLVERGFELCVTGRTKSVMLFLSIGKSESACRQQNDNQKQSPKHWKDSERFRLAVFHKLF